MKKRNQHDVSIEALSSNVDASVWREDRVTPGEYSTKYMLESSEQQVAIAYEVARSQGCSLDEAVSRYNTTIAPLSSVGGTSQQRSDAISFAIDKTTIEKPTIVMVNYKVGIVNHWAPVIVSRNDEGTYEVTAVNSKEGAHYTIGISSFQDELVSKLSTLTQSKVVSHDSSRNVQMDNVCGLASADAAAIAIKAASDPQKKPIAAKIKSFILESPDQQQKLNPKTRKAAYTAQGQRTLAVVGYLSSLDNSDKVARKEALALPILELEKRSLVHAGLLTEKQAKTITNSEQVDQILVFKNEMNKTLKKTLPKPEDQALFYDQVIEKFNGQKSFNKSEATKWVDKQYPGIKPSLATRVLKQFASLKSKFVSNSKNTKPPLVAKPADKSMHR